MKFRRKQKQEWPQLGATPLENNETLQTLKALSDELLEAELVTATNTEAWFRSTAAAFEQTGPAELAVTHERAAAYSRIAREVIATTIVLRREQKEDGSSPSAYL